MDQVSLSFKVDVDTYIGLKKGVPALLELFREKGILSTFFVSFGPDNSGKTIRRVFTKKGFFKKILRTNAASTYGFPTLLYGTILPAPMIAESFPSILREIENDGHEVGIHGYNHVQWHDYLDNMEYTEIEDWVKKSVDSFKNILSHLPLGFAAPGWKINNKGLLVIDSNNFLYQSNSRGVYPFFPRLGDDTFNVLEIPTTLPTLDEIMGDKNMDNNIVKYLLNKLKLNVLNVFTIHAEIEGMSKIGMFSKFLDMLVLKFREIKICRLCDVALELINEKSSVPVMDITFQEISGRAGNVAVQVL